MLFRSLTRADVVLFDGTLFADDEMIATGTGNKTGRRMGHMPIDGEGGALAALAGLGGRRILTHINNTNPILIEGSAQRRKVEDAGFEIAEDGMEIVLRTYCPPRNSKRACATSARAAIIACTRSTNCCMAAPAPRRRCKPGRSIATIIRP